MTKAINEVFNFVNEHQGYRASLGVIASPNEAQTLLAWGAVNKDTDDAWVPELDLILKRWPDATWIPMNHQQASLFDQAYQREQNPRQDWQVSI